MAFLNPFFKNHFIYDNPNFCKPYLLQIVKKPLNISDYSDKREWLLNTFRFGGKTHEFGGFDPSMVESIASIMSFKGMGSAQYEWGLLPSCFDYFYYNSFNNFSFYLKKYPIEVHVICKNKDIIKIKNFINKISLCDSWIDLKKNRCQYLRDIPYFKQSIENLIEENDSDFCGWLELSNPFFFFIDKKMYQDSINLFMNRSKHYILND